MFLKVILILSLVLLVGCGEPKEIKAKTAELAKEPVIVEEREEKMTNRIAVLETSKGTIKFEIFEDEVPTTSKNFIELIENGFYKDMIWHRVVPGFVIQTGDPTGTGTGGSDKTIPLEITNKKHVLGAVGMARSQDPDSASSQFYITLAPQPSLDGSYAVFGQVTEGMDVVKKIQEGDKLESVKLA